MNSICGTRVINFLCVLRFIRLWSIRSFRLCTAFFRLLRNTLFVGAAWPFVLLCFSFSSFTDTHRPFTKNFLITSPSEEDWFFFWLIVCPLCRLSFPLNFFCSFCFCVCVCVLCAFIDCHLRCHEWDCIHLGWMLDVCVSSFVCSWLLAFQKLSAF